MFKAFGRIWRAVRLAIAFGRRSHRIVAEVRELVEATHVVLDEVYRFCESPETRAALLDVKSKVYDLQDALGVIEREAEK